MEERRDNRGVICIPSEDVEKALQLLGMRFEYDPERKAMIFYTKDSGSPTTKYICADNITQEKYIEANALLWGFFFGKRLDDIFQVIDE